MIHYLVHDCEIKALIPQKNAPLEPDYRYCKGWSDYRGMGLAVTCCYSSFHDRYFAFMDDNMNDLRELALEAVTKKWEVVGFNSSKFDEKLLAAWGVILPTTYDLLKLAKATAGAGTFDKGWKLEDCLRANGLPSKAGDGADAPKLYQQGRIGELINYCLEDVRLEKLLFERRQELISPVSGKLLKLPLWSETVLPTRHTQPTLFEASAW